MLQRTAPVRLGARRSCVSRASAPAVGTSKPNASYDMSESLSLNNIRSSLIRQEDTIIFSLIERAQFARNDAMYIADGVPVPSFDKKGKRDSLLEYVLRETEHLHAKLRRYTSPDEHPFFPDDYVTTVLPPIGFPAVLVEPGEKKININDKVMEVYIHDVLPGITAAGDDSNYGSSSLMDVICLQALSKRIHYGKFVAEAKFRAQTAEYTKLIKARDSDAIMELLTDKVVEQRVVERVRLKATTFGQDISTPNGPAADSGKLKVSPDVVARLYEEWVMPLTKVVEVEYLLKRLD